MNNMTFMTSLMAEVCQLMQPAPNPDPRAIRDAQCRIDTLRFACEDWDQPGNSIEQVKYSMGEVPDELWKKDFFWGALSSMCWSSFLTGDCHDSDLPKLRICFFKMGGSPDTWEGLEACYLDHDLTWDAEEIMDKLCRG